MRSAWMTAYPDTTRPDGLMSTITEADLECGVTRPKSFSPRIANKKAIRSAGSTPDKGRAGPLLSLPRFSFSPHDAFNVRQEHSQQSQHGHEGTHAIHKTDAGVIGKFTQERRCNARGAESETEEKP